MNLQGKSILQLPNGKAHLQILRQAGKAEAAASIAPARLHRIILPRPGRIPARKVRILRLPLPEAAVIPARRDQATPHREVIIAAVQAARVAAAAAEAALTAQEEAAHGVAGNQY